ncbi:MAG: ABC transporter ATP-binding protein [Anaerolineae bacterium]|nr:ABC transporter ATP-binding protein [Anaerolineae bacterium]
MNTTLAKVKLIEVIKEFPLRRGETEAVRAVNRVSMEIYDGEFFAMLGPSGCGKTTTLRLIAGFEQPSSGQILIDQQPMQGIPAFQRPVNTVFQDYALFPHMSVLQNVMFGLEMAKVPRKEAESRAREALALVRLPNAMNRKPRELSGGQQQRVALARALVKRPSVLLLDEPLGALDLKLRREMQQELKTMQAELGITFVFVTHDQEEALTMANRIAVMNAGEVLQIGTPHQIYETPSTRFVADFIGETNFLDGQLIAIQDRVGRVQLDSETTVEATLGSDQPTIGQKVTVAIRPEKVALHAQPELVGAGGVAVAETGLIGRVESAQYLGTDSRYTVKIGQNTPISVRVQNTGEMTPLSSGDTVQVSWDTRHARILLH